MKLHDSELDPQDIERVEKIAAFLQKNISKHYLIPELAAMATLNRQKFTEVFTKVYGKPPYAYLQDLRLEKAKELLLSNYKVKYISITVGFNSDGSAISFNRFFKKLTGMTPLAWRKSNQRKVS